MKPFKVSVTSVCPNTSVNFFKYDEDMEDYIREQFLNKGTMLSRSTLVSEDKLEEECIMLFNDMQDYSAFRKDEIVAYQEKIKLRFNMRFRIAVSTNFNEIELTKNIYNIYQH